MIFPYLCHLLCYSAVKKVKKDESSGAIIFVTEHGGQNQLGQGTEVEKTILSSEDSDKDPSVCNTSSDSGNVACSLHVLSM